MIRHMDQSKKQKLITQILIGSAWIDRSLEPEEKTYLQKILERYDLGRNDELLALLNEPIPVKTTEQWLVEYFKHSSGEERMQLLADIGKVLIADDTVSDVEHDLLDAYHALMAKIPSREAADMSVTDEIGKAVRQISSFVIDVINQVTPSSS